MTSAGRDGRGLSKSPKPPQHRAGGHSITPEYDVCCPNCQTRGDFM